MLRSPREHGTAEKKGCIPAGRQRWAGRTLRTSKCFAFVHAQTKQPSMDMHTCWCMQVTRNRRQSTVVRPCHVVEQTKRGIGWETRHISHFGMARVANAGAATRGPALPLVFQSTPTSNLDPIEGVRSGVCKMRGLAVHSNPPKPGSLSS